MFIEQSLQALVLWVSINLGLTLILALNVTRHRAKEGVPVGSGSSEILERAIRAHGNNIEYVPGALIGILMLVFLEYSSLLIHCLGGLLFIARISHAHGIQKIRDELPKTRVLGNILTWTLYLIIIGLLFYSYFNN